MPLPWLRYPRYALKPEVYAAAIAPGPLSGDEIPTTMVWSLIPVVVLPPAAGPVPVLGAGGAALHPTSTAVMPTASQRNVLPIIVCAFFTLSTSASPSRHESSCATRSIHPLHHADSGAETVS